MTTAALDMQAFVSPLLAAMSRRIASDDAAAPVFARISRALRRTGEALAEEAQALPVCRHLDAALATARQQQGPVGAAAAALAGLAPSLVWQRRASAENAGPEFHDGHANAQIIGAMGLERQPDVTVGVSLLAPGVRYPDHNHPPEELYLVLSPGEWRQNDGPWHAPGPGGIVHNPPSITHAMRSGTEPLLAVWLLWMGEEIA